MYLRGPLVILYVLAVLLPSGASAQSGGTFTGQIIFPIYVSDVEVSTTFYRDVLGFEFLGYWDYDANVYVAAWPDTVPPKYAGFIAGDQKFGLHKPVNEQQERCVGCGGACPRL